MRRACPSGSRSGGLLPPRPAVPVFLCGFVAVLGGFPCLLSSLLRAFRCRFLLCLRPFRTRPGWFLPVFRLVLLVSSFVRVGLVPSRLGLALAFGSSWRLVRFCVALSRVVWVLRLLLLWFGFFALPVTPAPPWRLVSLVLSRLTTGSAALTWFPRSSPCLVHLRVVGAFLLSRPQCLCASFWVSFWWPLCPCASCWFSFWWSSSAALVASGFPPSPWPRGPPLWLGRWAFCP